jgi:hypothetical protein
MPRRLVTLSRVCSGSVRTLQRTPSFITVGLARGLRRVVLGWRQSAARAQMYGVRLHIPAHTWFSDGFRQALWAVD